MTDTVTKYVENTYKLIGIVGPEGHLDYAMQHINDKPCAIYPMVYNMQQGIHCINKCPFAFYPAGSTSEIPLCTWFQLTRHIK